MGHACAVALGRAGGKAGSKHGKAYAAGDDGAYNLSDEAVTNTLIPAPETPIPGPWTLNQKP